MTTPTMIQAILAVALLLTTAIMISGEPRYPFSCVSTENGEYMCTDDPVKSRRMIDQGSPLMGSSAHLMPTGTAQRIDGSEQEKQAVRKVLEKMDEYIIHEVMSKSVYEPFRSRCKNGNELCAFWASVNECETNRIFMLNNCAAACRFCLLANTNLF